MRACIIKYIYKDRVDRDKPRETAVFCVPNVQKQIGHYRTDRVLVFDCVILGVCSMARYSVYASISIEVCR